jgi:hypothetical protein
MSDQAITDADLPPVLTQPAAPEFVTRSRWLYRILPLILFLAVVVAVAIRYRATILSDGNGYIPLAFAVVLSIFLSLLPAMICVVQNTTRRRQLNRLINLQPFPVGGTTYFRTALTSVDTMRTGAVDADFEAPLFTYFFVVFLGFVAVLLGYGIRSALDLPSVILGGMHKVSDVDFGAYQTGTFCVMAIAFVAAYVYSLGRLLDRVNNNDLYPISLYYYAVRVVIAAAAAAIVRHTADVFGLESNSVLLLVAFGIGFAPDLFIVAVSRRAFQAVKIWGSRDDPTPDTRPSSLSLLMIDDLSRDKIDRLSELGIDNAQVLSRQNPFLLLPRLPYDLGLIVDWIGQAQLYVLVKDEKLSALRKLYIRDVFDLHVRLECDTARPGVCTALGINEAEAPALLRQLDEDPSYARLNEVRQALVPQSAS